MMELYLATPNTGQVGRFPMARHSKARQSWSRVGFVYRTQGTGGGGEQGKKEGRSGGRDEGLHDEPARSDSALSPCERFHRLTHNPSGGALGWSGRGSLSLATSQGVRPSHRNEPQQQHHKQYTQCLRPQVLGVLKLPRLMLPPPPPLPPPQLTRQVR